MKWTMYSLVAILSLLSLTLNASGNVVFSDDFTGANGDPVNSAKWDLSGWSNEAVIADNKCKLRGTEQWAESGITSKTGANFLAAGTTTTYNAALSLHGSWSKAHFGIPSAVEFSADKNGSWDTANMSVSVGGQNAWSGNLLMRETTLEIIMTATTYEITLSGQTISGTHNISSSDGNIWFTTQCTGTWEDQRLLVDDVQISQVPEPATLSLLAVGGLSVLLRRKR